MYRKILIPTMALSLPGSRRAWRRPRQSDGASITFLTVTRPYRAGTSKTAAIEDTPAEYEAGIAAEADKMLQSPLACEGAGVVCDTVQIEDDRPYQAIIDTAGSKAATSSSWLPMDARASRPVARQRDGQGAYPLQNTGPRPSLTKHDIGRILASNVYGSAQLVQEIHSSCFSGRLFSLEFDHRRLNADRQMCDDGQSRIQLIR